MMISKEGPEKYVTPEKLAIQRVPSDIQMFIIGMNKKQAIQRVEEDLCSDDVAKRSKRTDMLDIIVRIG